MEANDWVRKRPIWAPGSGSGLSWVVHTRWLPCLVPRGGSNSTIKVILIPTAGPNIEYFLSHYPYGCQTNFLTRVRRRPGFYAKCYPPAHRVVSRSSTYTHACFVAVATRCAGKKAQQQAILHRKPGACSSLDAAMLYNTSIIHLFIVVRWLFLK